MRWAAVGPEERAGRGEEGKQPTAECCTKTWLRGGTRTDWLHVARADRLHVRGVQRLAQRRGLGAHARQLGHQMRVFRLQLDDLDLEVRDEVALALAAVAHVLAAALLALRLRAGVRVALARPGRRHGRVRVDLVAAGRRGLRSGLRRCIVIAALCALARAVPLVELGQDAGQRVRARAVPVAQGQVRGGQTLGGRAQQQRQAGLDIAVAREEQADLREAVARGKVQGRLVVGQRRVGLGAPRPQQLPHAVRRADGARPVQRRPSCGVDCRAGLGRRLHDHLHQPGAVPAAGQHHGGHAAHVGGAGVRAVLQQRAHDGCAALAARIHQRRRELLVARIDRRPGLEQHLDDILGLVQQAREVQRRLPARIRQVDDCTAVDEDAQRGDIVQAHGECGRGAAAGVLLVDRFGPGKRISLRPAGCCTRGRPTASRGQRGAKSRCGAKAWRGEEHVGLDVHRWCQPVIGQRVVRCGRLRDRARRAVRRWRST
eukprot:m.93522 g.93522  ORF g.93522 m.93522 type:complete len:487 (-) comp8540_c1_seq3:1267-2727(-)